jgi:hypothetical protein
VPHRALELLKTTKKTQNRNKCQKEESVGDGEDVKEIRRNGGFSALTTTPNLI